MPKSHNYTKNYHNFNKYHDALMARFCDSFESVYAHHTIDITNIRALNMLKSVFNKHLGYPDIKKKVVREISHSNGLEDWELYDFVLHEMFGGDYQKTDDFMSSDYCRYEQDEIQSMKERMRNQNPYISYQKVKSKLLAEIDLRKSVPGDIAIYSILLNVILDGDETKTDAFMLSEVGGYTKGNLRRIKKRYASFQNSDFKFEHEPA